MPHGSFQSVTTGHEVAGEPVEQLRVGRRIGQAEIVVGVDQAAAHQVQPDAIHLCGSEIGIVGSGEPVGEQGQAIAAGRRTDHRPTQHAGGNRSPRAGVEDLARTVLEDDLFPDELMLIQIIAAFVFQNAVIQAGKHGREAVIVVHRPAVEGMIVAAGTADTDAQEHLGHRFRSLQRITDGSPEISRRMGIGAARCGQDFPGQFLQRPICCDLSGEPPVEDRHPFAVQRFLFIAQHIRPLLRPELGKLGPRQ